MIIIRINSNNNNIDNYNSNKNNKGLNSLQNIQAPPNFKDSAKSMLFKVVGFIFTMWELLRYFFRNKQKTKEIEIYCLLLQTVFSSFCNIC